MKSLVKSILLSGAALLALAALPAKQAAAQVPPISIAGLNFNGNGCRNDGVDATAQLFPLGSPNPTEFQILFSNFIAQQGQGLPLAERQRFCNITVTLRVPPSLQFSFTELDYYGHADLPFAGVTGTQRTTYLFTNNPGAGNVTFQTQLAGPVNQDYTRTEHTDFAIWSPCGSNQIPVTIRAQVFLGGNPLLPATMDVRTIDGRVRLHFGFFWRHC
jgi:hypothetical protein